MENIKMPSALMRKTAEMLAEQYEVLLNKLHETEKRLENHKIVVEQLRNEKQALAEHCAELEKQLGKEDNF